MINKAVLLGRLGKDAEVKFTNGGVAVMKVSLATSEKFKDKAGNAQEATEWHNLTAFGKRWESLARYLVKGSLIYVEGKITTRSYEDKEGVKKYMTEIIVHDIQLCGGKNDQTPQPLAATTGSDPFADNYVPVKETMDDMEIPF